MGSLHIDSVARKSESSGRSAVAGITIQPSEFAKLAIVLYVADLLARRLERINDVQQVLMPIAGVAGVLVGLIVIEPDFGTGFMVLLIAAVMIFAAGLSYRYLGWVAAVATPALGLILSLAAYRTRRVEGWLDPWGNADGSGFQVVQSLLAVGTGGWTGRGLMNGIQKLFYLPEPHSDFIYAVIAEELGWVGATMIALAYMVIAWRGLHVAATTHDRFGAFLALGITVAIAVQALVNISVVIGLLPTKGIPLPFISAGGSSLLVSLVGMGILLNVSQHSSGAA